MDILDRSFFENNSHILQYCKDTFTEWYQLRYCNFWFVVIPSESKHVYKYYLIDIHDTNRHASIESNAYSVFINLGITTPKYALWGTFIIWNQLFQQATIENIRIYWQRKLSFLGFNIKKLALLLARIHAIQPWYIHGNIHPSNFYVLPDWGLWVFDLSTYGLGQREKDIARVFIHSNYSENFLLEFLRFYDFEISIKKIYLLALIELRELYIIWRSDIYKSEMQKIVNLINSSK